MSDPIFNDHEVVQRAPSDYVEMQMQPEAILKAWSLSMFAHEVLNKDGSIKSDKDMSAVTLEKYLAAKECLKRGEAVSKPIIGVGIMDNIEIGIGREIVAASYDLKINSIPVHMRQGQAKDIRKLLKA